MVDEILSSLLWRSRLAVRAGRARAFAGHGYADPSYRPPVVPFASVVGPLTFAVEPEREAGRTAHGLVAIPGHIIGAPRSPALALGGAGSLRLRFDRRVIVDLALVALPTTPFGDPATGPAIAARIQNEILSAVTNHELTDERGEPITDPAIEQAVARAVVRWSQHALQLAISSSAESNPSSVEVLPVPGDLAPALGLDTPAVQRDGRRHLHKLPPPTAVTIDVRLDLWAANQQDLAQMFHAHAASTPTRGSLALRPSLLAADAAAMTSTIRLLDRGEPTTRESLVHLESGDGLIDRVEDITFTATAPAALDATGFRLEGAGRIAATIHRPLLVPHPLHADEPAPLGFAVALGLAITANGVQNEVFELLTIRTAAHTVFRLEIRIERHAQSGGPPRLFGALTATSTTLVGGVGAPIETRWRLPLSTLEAAGTLHAAVDAREGRIRMWHEGVPQNLGDAFATPAAPIVQPGRSPMAPDMRVTLGSLAGNLPRAVVVSHLHVSREPLGPLDPRLRGSLTRADQLRPGDTLSLAVTRDGYRVSDDRALAIVVDVDGDEVTLNRTLPVAFARKSTLAFQEQCFFHQTGVKRRDDLVNRLYHTSFDYRLSALLDDPLDATSAALVLTTREELIAGMAREPGPRGPSTELPSVGSASIDLDPSPEVH